MCHHSLGWIPHDLAVSTCPYKLMGPLGSTHSWWFQRLAAQDSFLLLLLGAHQFPFGIHFLSTPNPCGSGRTYHIPCLRRWPHDLDMSSRSCRDWVRGRHDLIWLTYWAPVLVAELLGKKHSSCSTVVAKLERVSCQPLYLPPSGKCLTWANKFSSWVK